LAVVTQSVSTQNIEQQPWGEMPELPLWRAVLQQAVADYSRPSTAWCGLSKYQRLYAKDEARRWLFSPRRTMGSFLWCCDWLDIRPEVILNRLRPQQRVPQRRRIYALTARLGIEYHRLNDRRRRSVPAQVMLQPNL